jgi:hypothetical protein
MARSNHAMHSNDESIEKPRPFAGRTPHCRFQTSCSCTIVVAMLCCSLHFSRRQSVSHPAVRAVTVVLSNRGRHRCNSGECWCCPTLRPRVCLTHQLSHHAARQAGGCTTRPHSQSVTPETKLHRPTDLHACVEERRRRGWVGFGGLRDRPSPPPLVPGRRDVHSRVE